MAPEIERYEVELAGEGGQGLVLAGLILAEAAVNDGYSVVQVAEYGPESRGSASKSDVIISSHQISYPAVTAPDFVLCMSQESADKFLPHCKDGATVLIDSTYVRHHPPVKAQVFTYPLSDTAKREFGKTIYANVAALAFFAEYTGIITLDGLLKAVTARAPKAALEQNKKAFEFGRNLVHELQTQASAK